MFFLQTAQLTLKWKPKVISTQIGVNISRISAAFSHSNRIASSIVTYENITS